MIKELSFSALKMAKILEFTNTSSMQFEIAEDHIKREDLPSAVNALRSAIELGDDRNARLSLGEMYLHAGLVVQSLETFVEAYCNGDRSGPCLFGLCRASFLLGFDEESGEYFKEMFYNSPAFIGSGIPDDAIEEMGSAISDASIQDPDRGFKFVGKGAKEYFDVEMVEMIRTHPEKALPYFESFTKKSYLYVDARNYVALIYLIEGSPEIAMHECEKILEDYPDSVFAMSTLIACYSALGLKEKEEEIAKKIEEANVTDPELIVKISLAMCQADRHADAVRYFEKLSDRKYERNTLILLAIAYHNSGEHEKAKRTVRDAQKLYPKDSAYLVTLAELMYRKKEKLDYAVTLSGGLALAMIAECRSWFNFGREDIEFDFNALSEIMESERNYRIVYWYLTSGAKCYDGDDTVMLFRLMQTGSKRCIGLIKEILLDFQASPELKGKCARVLICGLVEKIYMLQGTHVAISEPSYPKNFESDVFSDDKRIILFVDAFAYAYTEAFMRSEGFEKKLSEEFDSVRDKVLSAPLGSLRSPYALGAVLYGRALKDEEYTEKELCDIFMISPATYRKYQKFIYEGTNDEESN